jgi:hypothetical protein
MSTSTPTEKRWKTLDMVQIDDEAGYLNELVEQFREMGPQISNLGDVTQEMIQTERRMFQK